MDEIYNAIICDDNGDIYYIFNEYMFKSVNYGFVKISSDIEVNVNIKRSLKINKDENILIEYLNTLSSLKKIDEHDEFNIYIIYEDLYWFDIEKIYDFIGTMDNYKKNKYLLKLRYELSLELDEDKESKKCC